MTDKTFTHSDKESPKASELETKNSKPAVTSEGDTDEGGGGAGKKRGGDFKKEKLVRLIDKGIFKARNFGNFLNKHGMDEHTVKETAVTKDGHEKQEKQENLAETEQDRKHWEEIEKNAEAEELRASEEAAEARSEDLKEEAGRERLKTEVRNNPDSISARTFNLPTEGTAQFFVSPEQGADQTRRLMRGEGQGVRQSTANTNNHLGVAIQGGEVASVLKGLRQARGTATITGNISATKQQNQTKGPQNPIVAEEKANTSGNRPKSRL